MHLLYVSIHVCRSVIAFIYAIEPTSLLEPTESQEHIAKDSFQQDEQEPKSKPAQMTVCKQYVT